MKLRTAIGFVLAAPMLAFGQTADQHSQPPPQFTDYRIPLERAALPRESAFQYVDLALLALMLLLTAWIVLTRRSRKELRIVSIFAVAYFGFYRLGCVCAIGSIQNVTFGLTHSSYRLPLTVAGFFVLPLLAALFFGRVFCGGVCPMGAMQDLVLIRSIKVPAGLKAILETVPYIYLGAAILFATTGTAFVICEYDPFVGMFRLHGHFWMIVFGGVVVALSMVIGRPYCRFLCPYSVLLKWCSHFARHSVSVTPDGCIQCHLCANACPFDSIEAPQVVPSNRQQSRRQVANMLAFAPVLTLALAAIGWRMSPVVASWDLRVHRARVLHQAQLNPSAPKTALAEAWDRHRHTVQEAYQEAAAVEKEFEVGVPLLGAWIGIVISLKSLSYLRRKVSTDYVANAGSCVSCARCYSVCPVPFRTYGLPSLPIIPSSPVEDREPVGGAA